MPVLIRPSRRVPVQCATSYNVTRAIPRIKLSPLWGIGAFPKACANSHDQR
jgi:hypothetical protein